MAKVKHYGKWHRPAFGTLHTRRAMPRDHSGLFALPREGSGDFRNPTASLKGPRKNATSAGDALWHNPVRLTSPDGSHRDEHAEAEYIPLRNGVPFRPYVWRSPGWEDRLARFGLDLTALTQIDRLADWAVADKLHDRVRPAARRNKRRKVAA